MRVLSPSSVLLRTQSDERLVVLARAGHERAFEAIVERYRGALPRTARRYLPEARGEDATNRAPARAGVTAATAGTTRFSDRSADRDHPLDRQPRALGDRVGHLDGGRELAERVAQLRQRDHLHVAAGGR